jgi:hypothetical protein
MPEEAASLPLTTAAPCVRCGGQVPPGEEGRMSGMCQTCLNGPRPATEPVPKIVMDGWGNLWHHFNDTGYLRLIVTTEPGRTLADIVRETGAVTAMTPADPMILLRERVNRDGVPRHVCPADLDPGAMCDDRH